MQLVEFPMKTSASMHIQWFIDDVLGSLNRMGINTDDCDGEDAPNVILSGWIFTQIESWRLKMDEVAHATRLCDAHFIAHSALASAKKGRNEN